MLKGVQNMLKFGAAIAFSLGLMASAFAQAKQDFKLINKTGYEISEVYVSASKENNWGDDIMSDDTLEDGQTLNVSFNNAGKTCLFDIKVVYEEDDSEAIWHDINLCKTEKVTIFYDRKKDETTANFD